MTDELQSAPYEEIVRRVLAGQLEPEVAAVQLVDLMEEAKGRGPNGLAVSTVGLSDSDAARVTRLARAVQGEVMRRLAPGPEAV